MNTNIKTNRPVSVSRASIISIQGDVSRRIGNMRAVTLENRIVNIAPILGPRKKDRELIDGAFGKTFCNIQP